MVCDERSSIAVLIADGMVMLWQRSDEMRAGTFGGADEEDDGQRESWFMVAMLRWDFR
jgi:hypothetical protein